jgi:hypothetical protein
VSNPLEPYLVRMSCRESRRFRTVRIAVHRGVTKARREEGEVAAMRPASVKQVVPSDITAPLRESHRRRAPCFAVGQMTIAAIASCAIQAARPRTSGAVF